MGSRIALVVILCMVSAMASAACGDHGGPGYHGRETIATRIIDLARHGVLDAKALCDRVVKEAKS
jgi:hypothetical protein